MFTGSQSSVLQNGASHSDHAELLYRVAFSSTFQKSNRLREFLLFVGERKLRNPDSAVREQEVWVGVFHRTTDLDSSQDTLVRVHASQLRKKLQQYFITEGKDEPVIIELPKGGYTPAFSPREVAPPQPAPPPERTSKSLVTAWVVAGALAVVSAAMLVQNAGLRRRAEYGLGHKPSVDALWRQLFGNGLPTNLALADSNIVVLENEIRQEISLQDYETRQFEKLAAQGIKDPAYRALALDATGRRSTGAADAKVAFNMALVFASNDLPVNVLLARNLKTSQISSQNSVLLGSWRANPWVGLFEDELHFRTVFEESPRGVYFANKAPLKGEKPEYREWWGHVGYCRIAFLPNPKATGNVLLISGTDVQMTEAGGDFITSERWVGRLRNSLGLRSGAPVPYFEALLEGQMIDGSVESFRFLTCHRH